MEIKEPETLLEAINWLILENRNIRADEYKFIIPNKDAERYRSLTWKELIEEEKSDAKTFSKPMLQCWAYLRFAFHLVQVLECSKVLPDSPETMDLKAKIKVVLLQPVHEVITHYEPKEYPMPDGRIIRENRTDYENMDFIYRPVEDKILSDLLEVAKQVTGQKDHQISFDEKEEVVLAALRNKLPAKPRTYDEIAKWTGYANAGTIREAVTRLVKKEIVHKVRGFYEEVK